MRTAALTELNFNAVNCVISANSVFLATGTKGSGLTVTFGAKVESIPIRMFAGSTVGTTNTVPNIKSVVFAEGSVLKTIGKMAFYNCRTIKEIFLPASVETIGEEAFNSCMGLSYITIPKNMTSIGSKAFYWCFKLVEVLNLSALDIKAGELGSDNGYVGTYALNVYTATQGVGKVKKNSDFLFYEDGEKGLYYLLGYTGDKSEITLPSSSYSGRSYEIYSYAFYWNQNLTGVSMGSGVTAVGESAFTYCMSLKNLSIGSNVTELRKNAFSYCTALSTVVIPNNVQTIGEEAFGKCSALENVTVGSGVTSIHFWAFHTCPALISVTFSVRDGWKFNGTDIDATILSNAASMAEFIISNDSNTSNSKYTGYTRT